MLNFEWFKRHKGQGMVEYILIVAVVVAIVFAAYKLLGKSVATQFQNAQKVVDTASDAD